MATLVTGGYAAIEKRAGSLRLVPNMPGYDRARAEFTWAAARRLLSGLPSGGLNIAHEAVDRHATGALATNLALRFIRKDGVTSDYTYSDLSDLSSRFANALVDLGVGKGDRVFVLTGRIPELYITALGTLKNRSVFSPLFSAFGPEPIRQRLSIGQGKVLVTTRNLFKKKVAQIRESLPDLEFILFADEDESDLDSEPNMFAWHRLVGEASDSFEIPPTDPEDMALLHFTSGTTGTPKGAIHVHDAVVAHHMTGRLALDFHPGDIFWCTADPGWVTGTSYGIISPLTNGITSIVDEGDFDPTRWYGVLQDQRVTIWYTAPTAIRRLMRAGPEAVRGFDLSNLRFIASVGEPLNPEGVVWGHDVLGLPIHDNWWQTETGGIMIANFPSTLIKPGSMGRPLPGIETAILCRDDQGNVVTTNGEPEVVEKPGVEGELALRPGWPSMFRSYIHDDERYRECFTGGWYKTGDLVRRDEDGYFWFVGRGDDVIKSAGHLIGPFEVESALMEHPAVVEAGVIGKPDPIAGEVVKAFVSLRPGFEPSPALRRELIGFGRKRLGTAVAPKEIEFSTQLPRTRSGKIMRRLLKARELGLPEGDLSTLEVPHEATP